MRSRIAQGLAVFVLFASLGAAQGPNNSGTAHDRSSPKPLSKQTTQKKVLAKSARPKPYQVGTASWYGQYFQGKETASGEPFNMYDLTAAHLTLPLGTRVKVTNLRNGRSVVVRINDRGPVTEGRIIDLSYEAAKTLDLKARGLQHVRLDIVEPETVAMLHPVARPE
jgi:rare lipoprotein A